MFGRSSSRRAFGRHSAGLSLVAASALWGTTGTAAVLASVDAAPPVVGAARLIFGALALAILAGAAGPAPFRALNRRTARPWALAAGLAVAVYQLTFFSAVARTGVAVGTLTVLGSAPVACGLLGRWWIRESLPPGWPAATALAITGCALLVLAGSEASVAPVGIALAAVAGACYGVYTVAVKRLLVAGHSQLHVVAGTLSVGALLVVPVLGTDPGPLLTLGGVALVVWLAAITVALAYALFVRGLAHAAAATAGTLSLAEPLTAAVLGVAVIGERPSPTQGVGALLLLGGLLVTAIGNGAKGQVQPSQVSEHRRQIASGDRSSLPSPAPSLLRRASLPKT